MRTVLILMFILSFNVGFGQEIFDFEKEIDSLENYHSQEINFLDTKENIKLSGTLITPKTNFSKIVIIAPGSGKDTRHSHYVMAERFLKNGIAVYRYDDRGIGKSEGKYKRNIKQNISDLYYAFRKLRQVDSLSNKTIGILGHSNGGYASVNALQKGLKIDFLILMSTPIEKKGEFLNHKFKTKKGKTTFKEVYESLKIPVLFITGTNDTVVNSVNTYKLLKELNNPKIEIQILEGLNHFLRIGIDNFYKTKDYNSLYEIDENALNIIIKWTTNTVANTV
ncbi:alpha/beta hydrolase [Lacinutrix mariniflava]|uniref:alpha/beta hydrolase n=1 Tax=Lacinutrix mariniflava TaxID=342955 RepID=UPI0006E3C855|nr:alpha/beta hydrolase [Lacinutrix mariniflava]